MELPNNDLIAWLFRRNGKCQVHNTQWLVTCLW